MTKKTKAKAKPVAKEAKQKGSKTPLFIILGVIGVVVCGVFSLAIWKLFLVNHSENFEEAKEDIYDDWEDFVEDMYTMAADEDMDEEEVLEEFEELLSDSQKQLNGIICWRVEEEFREDCKDLKDYLKETEDLSADARKIYEDNDEDDKEDELEEIEDDLDDYISDITDILQED